MTAQDIARLRELHAAATAGPLQALAYRSAAVDALPDVLTALEQARDHEAFDARPREQDREFQRRGYSVHQGVADPRRMMDTLVDIVAGFATEPSGESIYDACLDKEQKAGRTPASLFDASQASTTPGLTGTLRAEFIASTVAGCVADLGATNPRVAEKNRKAYCECMVTGAADRLSNALLIRADSDPTAEKEIEAIAEQPLAACRSKLF